MNRPNLFVSNRLSSPTTNLDWLRTPTALLMLTVLLIVQNCVWSQHLEAQEADNKIPVSSLEQLDQVVAEYIKDDRAVGAELLVIQDGQVLLHVAHGFSNRELEQPWKQGTLCNIRSMTKPITAAAAQLLIDRGQLKLDEPVATYLESFNNDRCQDLTLRHLLTHRSGFPLTLVFAPRQYNSLAEQVDAYAERRPGRKARC